MRISAIAVPSLLLLSTLALVRSPDALATGDAVLQRCEAADGHAVYTDKPCAMFRAQPTRISDDLSLRLALDNARDADRAPATGLHADASAPLQTSNPGRRSLAAGCARSPGQLSRDLVGAFALRDVNRIAESYYWVGLSHRQSLPVMKQLERLSAKPLADARFLSAWIGSGEVAASAIPDDGGLMQLVFAGDGGRIVDFEVRRYAGCYFISA